MTRYIENPEYTPSPFDQSGTVSTSDTAGFANNSVREVSPVFDEGRARALAVAAKAIDPDDPTPSELVVLPEGAVTVTGTAKTADEGREDILRALSEVEEHATAPGELSPERQAAARALEDSEIEAEKGQESDDASDGPRKGPVAQKSAARK